MNKRIAILFIFLVSVLFIFCEEAKVAPEFTNVSVTKTYNNCDINSDSCAYLKFDYPIVKMPSNLSVAKQLNDFINSELTQPLFGDAKYDSINELASQFFNEYKEMKKEFADYSLPWTLEKNIEIKLAGSKCVSITAMTFSFTGGAHPNTVFTYTSFDTQTGKRITIADLIDSIKINSFLQLAENTFREAKNISRGKSLESAGFWFNEGFYLPENFIITASGLTIFYNTYEIAPYALGTTELNIQLEKLEPFLAGNNINYWQ